MSEREVRRPGADLQLHFADYSVTGASISHKQGLTKFSFIIAPVSDATVAALGDATVNHQRICVLLPQPLLLNLLSLERKEPRAVRIVGRVIVPDAM